MVGVSKADVYDVLLVDDDVSFLELTSTYLEDDLLDITCISDPEDALDIYSDFDCIISDYQMPGMDGLELLKEIRKEEDSDIPFIMFTGKGREEVAMDALNLGADRYLQKGGDPKTQFMELKHALKESIDKKQTEKKLRREKKRAKQYFETTKVLMVAIDKEGEITDLNEKASEVLGETKDDLIGRDWFNEFIVDECTEEAFEVHQDVLERDSESSIEIKINTIDNEERVISWRISQIVDEEGRAIGTLGSGLDITDRKKREDELSEKTYMLEGMLDGLEDVVGFQLPDHTILRYNKKGYEVLEIDPEEARGEKCYSLIGRDEPCEYCPTERAMEEKEIVQTEKHQPELDKYLSITANPIINDEGEIEFVIEQLRDITENKEYEKKLERISREYETIFQNVQNSIFLLDVDGEKITIQRWNPYEEELMGFETQEVQGKTPKEVFGEEKGEKMLKNYRDCIEKEETIEYEEMMEIEGEKIHTITKLAPIKRDNEVDMIVGTSLDITERKKKEEKLNKTLSRLKTLMESIEIGILFEDKNREIIYANQEFCSLFNIPDKKHVLNRDCRELAEQAKNQFKDPDRFREGIEKLVDKKQKKKSEELELKDDRILLRDYIPIKDKGEINGHLWSYRDITKIKKMEKREEFLHSFLRHDVQNKLQVTEGYLKLIDQDKIETETQEKIQKAIKSNEEANKIIEKVKKLRKLQKEEKTTEKNLEKILNEVVTEIQKKSQKENIEIKKDLTKCSIEAGSLLKEVFYNIIENAVKHADCSQIKIKTKEKQDSCIIKIKDNGKGLPKEEHKIYQQGYSHSETGGSGLGLYIAKQAIKNYDGEIKHREPSEGGTEFQITLKKPINQ